MKTLWAKEKLLVTNDFSSTHIVFCSLGELYSIFFIYEMALCKLLSLEESKICRLGKGYSVFSHFTLIESSD